MIGFDLAVDVLQERRIEILPVVDAAAVPDVLLERDLLLLLDRAVVQVRVEHNNTVDKNERRVRVAEDVRIVQAEALRKLLHDAINFLRLARKTELAEEAAQRGYEVDPRKLVRVDERVEDSDVEVLPFAEVVAGLRLVQVLAVPGDECGNCGGTHLEKAALDEELDGVLRLFFPDLDRLLHQFALVQHLLKVDARRRHARSAAAARRGERGDGGGERRVQPPRASDVDVRRVDDVDLRR